MIDTINSSFDSYANVNFTLSATNESKQNATKSQHSTKQATNDKAWQATNDKSTQDFSWKFGTPWEMMSDEWLKEMSEQTKKSFERLMSEYDKLTKEMPVRENSVYQQLKNGTADTALINEINEFKNKNTISQFGGIGLGSILDKDIESIYRTATNADEFKASWLALKEKRSNEVIDSVLKNGFGTSGVILSNDDIKALNERLASENFARQNAQKSENLTQNSHEQESKKIVVQLNKNYENTSIDNLRQLFNQQSVDTLKLLFGFLGKFDIKA